MCVYTHIYNNHITGTITHSRAQLHYSFDSSLSRSSPHSTLASPISGEYMLSSPPAAVPGAPSSDSDLSCAGVAAVTPSFKVDRHTGHQSCYNIIEYITIYAKLCYNYTLTSEAQCSIQSA